MNEKENFRGRQGYWWVKMLNENTDARDIYVTFSAMFLLESEELFITPNGRIFGKT